MRANFHSRKLLHADFLYEICYILILLFVKLVHLSFLLVKLMFFMELAAFWFLFLELVLCWFFLVKLVAYRFFSCETDLVNGNCCVEFYSWNFLHVDLSLLESCWLFLSSRETDFANGNYCALLFVHATCCELILFMELIAGWFCSWNFLHV